MKESVMYRTPATAALVVGLLVALGAVLWLGVGPAEAAFPGSNGKIAFDSDRDGNFEIYTMNADGSGKENLTNHPDFDRHPAWSADGSKIAFSSTRDGAYEIYTMNADGSGLRRLAHPGNDYLPAWSPDGSKIAFESDRHGLDEVFEIYTMNADGSGVRQLTNTGDNGGAAWSPDGRKIAFMSYRDGDWEIYSMNANDGSGVRQLTNNTSRDGSPDWSPDGSGIAFTSDRDGDRDIYTMNADGSGLGRLAHPADDDAPAWSPDGSRIAFMSDRDGEYEIYTMNAEDGSGVDRLTNDSAFDSSPDWQPLAPPPIDVGPILPTPPLCSSSRAWWCELLINDPIIRRVPPAPGLIIRDHVPPIHLTPIKALVRDRQTDLQKEDIQLFVDGMRESGFSYEKATDTLSYAVDELSVGRHEVRIVARDVQGNATTETWSFEVAKR